MTRLEQLRAQADEIHAIAARHKATAVAVFGSVARGEDRSDSDIDLLVDFEPGATLFEQFYLQEALEALLNVHVDVIPRSGLKPRDNRIREEALAL
jgi:predicted nucleotidyltransferase